MKLESLTNHHPNNDNNLGSSNRDERFQFTENIVQKLKNIGMSDYQAYKMVGSGFKVDIISRINTAFIFMIIAIVCIIFLIGAMLVEKTADYLEIAPVLRAKVSENWQYNVQEVTRGLDSTYDSEYYILSGADFTGEDFNAELTAQASPETNSVTSFKVGEDIKPGIYTVDMTTLDHFELTDAKIGNISSYKKTGGLYVNLPLYDGDIFETGCKYNPYNSADTCEVNLYAQEQFVEYSQDVQVPGIYVYGLSNMNDTTTINTRDYDLYQPGKDGRYDEFSGNKLNDVNDGKFYFNDRYNIDVFDTEFTFNNIPGSYLIIDEAPNANSLNKNDL